MDKDSAELLCAHLLALDARTQAEWVLMLHPGTHLAQARSLAEPLYESRLIYYLDEGRGADPISIPNQVAERVLEAREESRRVYYRFAGCFSRMVERGMSWSNRMLHSSLSQARSCQLARAIIEYSPPERLVDYLLYERERSSLSHFSLLLHTGVSHALEDKFSALVETLRALTEADSSYRRVLAVAKGALIKAVHIRGETESHARAQW